MKRKIILRISGLIAVVVFITLSLVFASIERKVVNCNAIQVMFEEDYQFVTAETIEKRIRNKFKTIDGYNLDTLDTEAIEIEIEKLAWVKKAEVFKGYSTLSKKHLAGVMNINIEQEVPYLRVVDGADGYYMTKEGKHLPFSSSHTAHVMVVTGRTPDKLMKEKIIPFIEYINDDKFLKALFQQIHIQSDEELVLVPRVGNQLIEIGEATNLDRKFRNLKALYEEGFKYGGWEKYRTITLKYDNQVVCTLR